MEAIIDGPLPDWVEDIERRLQKGEDVPSEDAKRYFSYLKDDFAMRAQAIEKLSAPFIFTEDERSLFLRGVEPLAKMLYEVSDFIGMVLEAPWTSDDFTWEKFDEALQAYFAKLQAFMIVSDRAFALLEVRLGE